MDPHRFGSLWHRLSGRSDSTELFDALICHYRGPDRHYHDVGHIVTCLNAYDRAAIVLGTDDAVEMALWFHDAILIPGARDNEACSVAWFEELSLGQLPEPFIAQVSNLIMATRHRDPPESPQAQFVVDVDLWGLGQSWEEFFADTRALRRERAELTDTDFARDQRGFLESLVDRPNIYLTSHFQHLFEHVARDNIHRLFGCLDSGVSWQ